MNLFDYSEASIRRNICFMAAYTILCFLIEECIGIFAPEMELIRTIFKGLIFGGLLVFCLWGMKAKPENRDKVFFIAMIGYLIADQVITYYLIGGIVVYSIAHIIMITRLIRIYKQPKWIYAVIIASTVVAGLILHGPAVGAGFGDLFIPVVFYLFLLLSMMYLSFQGCWYQWTGAVIFMLSDVLLIRNFIVGETYLSHAISLGAFYLGIMFWSLSTWRTIFRKNMIR